MDRPEDIAALRTARLTLRPPRQDDAASVVALLSDARVLGRLRLPNPYTRADADEFIARVRAHKERVWFIEDAVGLIGCIGLEREFGYWLGRRAWGCGYATEAGRAVLGAHFADEAAGPVVATYRENNLHSAAVLRKLGFGPVAGSQNGAGQPGMARDVALTPEQWHYLNPLMLETERLVLRPLTACDADALSRIGGQEDIARMMLSLTAPWPRPDVLRWIEHGRWRGTRNLRLGVCIKDGPLIGAVGLFGNPFSLHFMIDRAYQGQGLATEALRAAIRFGFDRFRGDRIEADHFIDNLTSGRVLAKLGFERIGESTGQSAARLEPAPIILYRLRRQAEKTVQ